MKFMMLIQDINITPNTNKAQMPEVQINFLTEYFQGDQEEISPILKELWN